MPAAASRDRVVVAGLGVDVELPGGSAALVTGGMSVLVVRGEDGVLRAFTNTCRHRHPLVVAERAGSGMAATASFTCPFAGWPEPHGVAGPDGAGPVRPLAVAEGHGLVLVRPGGAERIDVAAVVDATTARRLDGLGLERVERAGSADAAPAVVRRDAPTVVQELAARRDTVVVAEHTVVEPVAGGVGVTRVFALAADAGCVVDRRRYRLRA